ncbi:heme A synthase [Janibacter sp. GXQ6167]|uniref:COX15/CtaA family protein n=1 Tax=Janibacter sp. GXQ6167 TaxID=3240791 RepID=UPI003523264B
MGVSRTPLPTAEPTTTSKDLLITSPWVGRLLVANLVVQVGIIVTGGLVRLTGSGLGCPTWPQCTPGSYTPTVHQEQGFHKHIEFGNRLLTWVLTAVAIALLVALYKWARQRTDLIRGAWIIVAGIVAQALLGGVTVLTGLNPWTVAFHFLASAALVAVAAWMLWRSQQRPGPRSFLMHPLAERLAQGVAVVTAVVLVLGTIVTGSGPHSGDATTPARTGFDPRAMSWLHADAVMLLVGLVIAMWVAARMTSRSERATRAWALVVGVVLAQGLIGYVQYFTKLPEVLVLAHMLGAALLVVVVTRAMVLSRTPTD